MALEWLRRDNELKDHQLFDNSHFGKDARRSSMKSGR